MIDEYWNNMDSPGLRLSKEEYYDWLKNSKVIDEHYLYHDFAGGYEHEYILEKDGYEYRLVSFNGHGEEFNVITYILHRGKRCLNQDGEGI